MQQIEQRRTADAEAEGRRMQVAIGQVENPDSPLVLAPQTLDPGPGCQGVLLEAQRPQDGKAGGLQQQAGAYGMGLLEALQHGDVKSGIGEKACGGLTGNAAAHDTNLKRPQRHPPS